METILKAGTSSGLRLAIVCDVFPPSRSSGAVQLRDLSRQLVASGHRVTVLTAAPELFEPWQIAERDGVEVVRLRTPRTRDTNYVRRTLAEFAMPFAMRRNLARSPASSREFDGIISYSPTIFLGPLVRHLKARNKCPSYLILRDVFPEWAMEMGLMGPGLPYRIFRAVANYQYRTADIIGIQSKGNLAYFEGRLPHWSGRIEVLDNWLSEPEDRETSLSLDVTPLAGRKIFIYAGNMGVAQQMDKLLNLAFATRNRQDIGFLFVGRGSDVDRLKNLCTTQRVTNVTFMDEIDPSDLTGLLSQCHCGLISLDCRHRSHNIPGKLLTYLQAGLPVLASINEGNDLEDLINVQKVGRVSTDNSGIDLPELLNSMIDNELNDPEISQRCQRLWRTKFSVQAASSQIVSALKQMP